MRCVTTRAGTTKVGMDEVGGPELPVVGEALVEGVDEVAALAVTWLQ
jgi:hypothetical protein